MSSFSSLEKDTSGLVSRRSDLKQQVDAAMADVKAATAKETAAVKALEQAKKAAAGGPPPSQEAIDAAQSEWKQARDNLQNLAQSSSYSHPSIDKGQMTQTLQNTLNDKQAKLDDLLKRKADAAVSPDKALADAQTAIEDKTAKSKKLNELNAQLTAAEKDLQQALNKRSPNTTSPSPPPQQVPSAKPQQPSNITATSPSAATATPPGTSSLLPQQQQPQKSDIGKYWPYVAVAVALGLIALLALLLHFLKKHSETQKEAEAQQQQLMQSWKQSQLQNQALLAHHMQNHIKK